MMANANYCSRPDSVAKRTVRSIFSMAIYINCKSNVLSVSDGQNLSCRGVINSKRNLKALAFFMLDVGEHRDTDQADEKEKCLVQLVVNLESADTRLRNYAQHMSVGTSVQCSGTAKFDRPGCLSVYLQSVRILKCSAEPDAIMRFISDDFTNRELNVCEALSCSELQYAELRSLVASGAAKAKQLKQAIAKHSRVMVSTDCSYCLLHI